MDYTEIRFNLESYYPLSEIIIAGLAEAGFESFSEEEPVLSAFIPSSRFNPGKFSNLPLIRTYNLEKKYKIVNHADRNWNEIWESHFEPVEIGRILFIRAPFHEPGLNFRYEIIIEPKMSFGTAHHETTALLLEEMAGMDFSGRSVLDLGCGTGILAIFSELLGGKEIVAIDNDEWAYRNALENTEKNKCSRISVLAGDESLIEGRKFDIILANINKNYLAGHIPKIAASLHPSGCLLISGFYVEDRKVLEKICEDSGLKLHSARSKNKWVALTFVKQE